MKKNIIVLGAGMVGVSTALHLQKRGHDVLLVDRTAPGKETSYGNAGIIQREAVEPYPFPRDAGSLLRYMLNRGAATNYHFSQLPKLLPILKQYWKLSGPAHYPEITQAYSSLIAHCITEHAEFVGEAQADELIQREGFRFAFRDQANYQQAITNAKRINQLFGVRYRLLSGEELALAEPALTYRFVGAIQWLDPWSVNNPGELVVRYAELFKRRGGQFAHGNAASLTKNMHGWQVQTDSGIQTASDVVIALGPWSDVLTRQLGYELPLYVKRGYHRHFQTEKQLNMPMMSADDAIMLSPMQRGLRIATGVELADRDAPKTPVQMLKAEKLASSFIQLGKPVEDSPWMGARPCTVDMKPVIGPAPRHEGLWFNFGHSHQGFTLGPASGRLLAEMIDDESTYIDASPFLATRFSHY
jgi:D-amino-acid dehydrogenase